jgi:hypothetical protein
VLLPNLAVQLRQAARQPLEKIPLVVLPLPLLLAALPLVLPPAPHQLRRIRLVLQARLRPKAQLVREVQPGAHTTEELTKAEPQPT